LFYSTIPSMASSSRDELIFETPDVKPRVEEKTDGRHDHPSGQEVADIDTSPVDLKAAYQAHQSRAGAFVARRSALQLLRCTTPTLQPRTLSSLYHTHAHTSTPRRGT